MATYTLKKARKAGPTRLLTEKELRDKSQQVIQAMPVDPYGFRVWARGNDRHNVYASPGMRSRAQKAFALAYPQQKAYADAYGIGMDLGYYQADEENRPLKPTPEFPDRKTDVGMWQSRNSVESSGRKFKIWAKAFDIGRRDGAALKITHLTFRKTGKFPSAKVSSVLTHAKTLTASDDAEEAALFDAAEVLFKSYKVTAADYDYSEYGYWITDTGALITVPQERHANVARNWIEKNNPKAADHLRDKEGHLNASKAFDFVQSEWGWVRIQNHGLECNIAIVQNTVSRLAYKTLRTYIEESPFHIFVVDTSGNGYLHKTFVDPKPALAFVHSFINKNLTALIEAAELQIKAGHKIKVYRGEYSGNKGGVFWTEDKEFARNFTQSGQDKEIRIRYIDPKDIDESAVTTFAGDEAAVTKALAHAKKNGFKVLRLSEGDGEPLSLYVMDKSALTLTATDREKHYGKSLYDQGKADFLVIYRAVPRAEINFKPGDYVTLSKKFAVEHAEHNAAMGEPSHVIKIVADPRKVYDALNPGEYFYGGEAKRGKVFYTTQDLEAADTVKDKLGYPIYWSRKGKAAVFVDKNWYVLGDRLMRAFDKQYNGFEEYNGAYVSGFKYGYRNPMYWGYDQIDQAEAKLFTKARREELTNEGYDDAEYINFFFEGVKDGAKIGEYHKDYITNGKWDPHGPDDPTLKLEGSDMRSDLLASLQERMTTLHALAEPQSYTNKTKSVKLIYYANRSTPQTCKPGQTVKAKAGYGKRTKIKTATPEQVKQLKAGRWVRDRHDGKKPGEKGAKKTRYRPWLTGSIEKKLTAAGLL